jgi:ribonuclease HI
MFKSYTDGAVRVSNPGVASCAWVLYDTYKPEWKLEQGTFLGSPHSNNYAEYQGLLTLLQYLYEQRYRNVVIYCDSKLVVEQTNQRWEVNSEELRPLMSRAYGLLVQGTHVLKHIKGHEGEVGNERADELCNMVLDEHKEEYEKQN